MAVIGTLNVVVAASVDKALKGFKRTEKGISNMKRASDFASTRIAALGGTLLTTAVAAVSVSKAIDGVRDSMQRLDTLAKTSDKLGLDAADLAGLRFAAEQTGVAITSLDTGLQRMVRRVAEAAQGTGEAQGALKELGLDAKALNRLSPDQQFREIADAMSRVSNQSDRVRIGFKLFDTEGVALVNTLKGGSKALNAYQRQAEALGIAVGSDALRSVESSNDAVNRLSKSWEGFFNTITVKVAPALTVLGNLSTSLVQSLAGVSDFVAASEVGFARGLADTFKRLANANVALGAPSGVFEIAANHMKNYASEAERAADAAKKLAEIDTRPIEAFSGLSQPDLGFQRTESQIQTVTDVLGGLNDELDRLRETPEKLLIRKLLGAGANSSEIMQAKILFAEIEKINNASAQASAQSNLMKQLQDRADQLLETIKTNPERIADRIREINELGELLTSDQKSALIEKAFRDILGDRTSDIRASIAAPPQARQRGSFEANSAEVAAINRLRGEKSARDMAEKQREESNRELKEIRRAVQKLVDQPTVEVTNN